MLFLHTEMQEFHHMLALQLCLVAALAAVVYSDCSIPKHLPFAVLRTKDVKESYPVGTNVTYRCKPDYVPIPGTRPVITCLETSEWSEISSFCQERHCPFPDIENGEIANITDLRLGDQITFVCNKGYRLIGQNGARCILVAGRVIWNREPPHCERISCFPPPTIINGKHSGIDRDNYDYGLAVTYNCESGFSLIGIKTIVCTTDDDGLEGKWTEPAPRCEVVECRRPEISNGKIVSSYQPSYTYGDTVMFECYCGNILQGKNIIKCEANNTWHPAPPICVPRDCDPPTLPPFAVLKTEEQRESYPVGTTLTFHCISGYEKIPGLNPIIQCLTTSKWSQSPQLCQKRQCPFPNIQNGNITSGSGLQLGNEVTFVCNKGYRLIGQNSAHCVFEDGNVVWNRDPPHCELVTCSRPEVSNGQILFSHQTSYKYGDTVSFLCNLEYILHGNRTSKCEADSSWHPAPPTCVPYSCDPPTELYFAELLDANKDKTSYPVGSVVKYKCQLGYSKNPEIPFFIKCLPSMKWSSVHVLCKKQSCGDPGQPRDGRLIIPKDFLFGSTVNFTCDEGHRLIGQSSIQCVVSGERVAWSDEIPLCQRSCGPPPRLYFAELIDEYKDKTSFPVHSSVKYACRPGYYGLKRASLTCLESLEWSEAQKFCIEKKCSNPGEPPNGRLIVPKDLNFGSTVNFTCDEGHRLLGPSSIRCVITGQTVAWTAEIPLCQRIPCYPPPDILHGKKSGNYNQDYYYGDIVTYTCDKGYPSVGDEYIHCTTKDGENGVWSGSVSCEVTPCPAPEVENGGIVTGDSGTYIYKHKVTLGCSADHILTGSREIYCQADGTWDPPVPLCEQGGLLILPSGVDENNIISTERTLLLSSGANITSVFDSQAPAVIVPNYTSALPTPQTELALEKLFIILQEIKDIVNIKTTPLEERLDELEKKVDKIAYELKSCCQQSKERLEEKVNRDYENRCANSETLS